MEVKNKQKSKKRKTHRNLNLRKRPHSEMHNNVNPTKENTHKDKKNSNDNELIACERLTLALFKKSVRSKTITRVDLSRIDNTRNVVLSSNKNIMSNILKNCSNPSRNRFNAISENSIICKNDYTRLHSPEFSKHTYGIIDGEDEKNYTVLSYNPSHCVLVDFDHLTTKVQSDNCNNRSENVRNFSSSPNSETESGLCSYEKFMNGLPAYFRKHFPTLMSNFENKNISYIKQRCLGPVYQDIQNNDLNHIEVSVNISQHHKQSIIQNPMEYIQTGLLWERNVQTKQSLSSISNDYSPWLSDAPNIFLNSPEYKYFPHKLNH